LTTLGFLLLFPRLILLDFLLGDITVFAVFVVFLPLVYFNRLMDFSMTIILDFTKSDCPSAMGLFCKLLKILKKEPT
jgi:hypothetical protein